MAVEITPITSESLQAAIRTLLPSQVGFGDDLQATNLITPVIDLTSTAAGTSVPEFLSQAINFGGSTGFRVANATNTVVINNTGFFRVRGNAGNFTNNGFTYEFNLFDGATSKTLFDFDIAANATAAGYVNTSPFDFIVFLTANDSLRATSGAASAIISGNFQQIADINGTITNPVGFTPQ
jgi:hypothetical protein